MSFCMIRWLKRICLKCTTCSILSYYATLDGNLWIDQLSHFGVLTTQNCRFMYCKFKQMQPKIRQCQPSCTSRQRKPNYIDPCRRSVSVLGVLGGTVQTRTYRSVQLNLNVHEMNVLRLVKRYYLLNKTCQIYLHGYQIIPKTQFNVQLKSS